MSGISGNPPDEVMYSKARIPNQSTNTPAKIPPAELAWALGFLVAGLILRIGYIFYYSFDTDESQHLHVVWSVANGYLQYRDVFDNHTPLFQSLFAPVVYLFGDCADLLIKMRLAMLPVYGLTLWCVYRIASGLFTPRLGLWAAVCSGLFPLFFTGSAEFRTDDLWSMFCLMTISVLVKKEITPFRGFLAGLILGAAISTSMKTILFIASMFIAGVVVFFLFYGFSAWRTVLRKYGATFLAAVLGFLLIPSLFLCWFYSQDAIGAMYYCVIQHNLADIPGNLRKYYWRKYLCLPLLVLLFGIAWRRTVRLESRNHAAAACEFVYCFACMYYTAVLTLWPLIRQQDFLPVWPLFVIGIISQLHRIPPCWPIFRKLALSPKLNISGFLPFLLFAMLELLVLTAITPLVWNHKNSQAIDRWKTVLALTKPGETVMDLKGELLFRPRAFFYVLETITRFRIMKGDIPDTIAERMISAKTCVAASDLSKFPLKARNFIEENYVSIGHLRVAGQFLNPDPANPGTIIRFEVKIPEEYSIIHKSGSASGILDGTNCKESQILNAGIHEYQPAENESQLALVWARAIRQGCFPLWPPAQTMVK